MVAAFIAARIEAMEDLQRISLSQAWHTAALTRMKRLPKLETLIAPAGKRARPRKFKPKSWQQIMEACRATNAALGGTEEQNGAA